MLDMQLEMRRQLAQPGKAKDAIQKRAVVFDDASVAGNAAETYTTQDIALKSASALHQWVETDDLDDGETLADRLVGLMIGIADANQDGEIDEDEQSVIDTALNAAWDYLSQSGVEDSDIAALLEDQDDDAAERVRDFLASSLPDGDESAMDDINNFAFGSDGDQESTFDSATYKKKIVFRHGQKTKVNKRISGHVKLSSKQKLGIRKMLLKSHSAGAQSKRKRSVKARYNAGM